MKQSIYFALSVCMVSAAQAQTCNPKAVRSAPDSRYELVVDRGGSEVLDKQTGLIWQRCSLGQTWSGTTCTGITTTHTFTDALAQAKAVGDGYRLPNMDELRSLIAKGCIGPVINLNFFPNTERDGYWSASYNNAYDSGVWVNFNSSYTGYAAKNVHFHVRAVRAGQ